jgi:DMSO/TMAO reductase YedYZ molybdopterin-dependent catalytic subunit
MKKEWYAVTAVGIFAILLIVGVSLKSNGPRDTIELPFSEITEYEGKDLSSLNDFRENSIKGPQYIDIENYHLEVSGLVDNPINHTYADVLKLQNYSKVITLYCVEGWDVTILWEGIILRELLEQSTPSSEATTIIFYAEDGYTTSYPIEYIMEQDILMAHRMNNETMVPERGFPFQLVAEDKWGYKWIKWITKIEFSSGDDYEGFWESRGYSNTGNLNESSRK